MTADVKTWTLADERPSMMMWHRLKEPTVASVSKEPNGRYRIDFKGLDNLRRTVRLGKVSDKVAREVHRHVEVILACAAAGSPLDQRTAQWLGDLADAYHAKLVKAGLVHPRKIDDGPSITVELLVDRFVANQKSQKPSTRTIWGRVKKHLVRYFREKPIQEITRGDAIDWMNNLIGRPMAENTVRRHCGMARQFFDYAVSHEWINGNPFDSKKIKTTVRGNKAKFHFVTADDAAKILDACPSQEWRVIFALSRWGGLRCPSEHLSLKWGHVNWEHGRLTVPSPKTEHHEGHEERITPLFPELRKELDALYAEAEPGEWIITRYRDVGQNLRTTFGKIVKRAGLKPWSRPFHNLRATRETELADQFPAHVVVAWIGNSEAVAREHYLRTRDEHFEKAISEPAVEIAVTNGGMGANGDEFAVAESEKTPENQGFSAKPGGRYRTRISNDFSLKTEDSEQPAVQSAVIPDQKPVDPLLGRLVVAWDRLTADERLAVLEFAESRVSPDP